MATAKVDGNILLLHRRIAYEAAEAGKELMKRQKLEKLEAYTVRSLERRAINDQRRCRQMDKVRYEIPHWPGSRWAIERALWENNESSPKRAVSPLAEP